MISIVLSVPIPAQGAPVTFSAAGPDQASIQATVDAFRAALGAPNNGNSPGPLASGRREINWDGGGSTATALAPTPFTGFLATRGGLFTTAGTGFVQAPVSGLVTTFGNPTYSTIFQFFSKLQAGDLLVTGAQGRVQWMSRDESVMALAPNSRLTINLYSWGDGEDASHYSLKGGGIGVISGEIQAPAYKLSTEAAEVTVNGTQYKSVVCAGNCAGFPSGIPRRLGQFEHQAIEHQGRARQESRNSQAGPSSNRESDASGRGDSRSREDRREDFHWRSGVRRRSSTACHAGDRRGAIHRGAQA